MGRPVKPSACPRITLSSRSPKYVTLGDNVTLGAISLYVYIMNALSLKVDTQHENQKRGQPNTRGPDNYKKAHGQSFMDRH